MTILKDSIIYLAASIISKSAPFLLLPLLTNYLSPDEFGLLAIFLVINSLYAAFIGMSLQTNLTKNFFNKTKSELALINGNILLLLFASFIAYSILTLLVISIFDSVFSIPSNFLLILPFMALLSTINQIHLALLRNEGRSVLFGLYEISNAVIVAFVTVFLILFCDRGWLSQIYGMLVAAFVLGLIGLRYLFINDYLKFRYNKLVVRSILKVSLPLIPHVVGGVVISVSDRLFIEKFVGLEVVALYSIGYSFGMIVSLFIDALIKAWSPWFYRQLVRPNSKKKVRIVKLTYCYLVGIFLIAFFISFLSENIFPYVVDSQFQGGSIYIWWIAVGYAVQGIYKIFFPYLVHINKTSFLAVSTLLAAVVNLGLNYLLILEYGAMGAAYATIIAFFVSSVFVFEYQRRKFPMPWLFTDSKAK